MNSGATTIAVFSGAGISGEAPAALPRGFGLRNDLLRQIHAAAARAPSAGTLITAAQLGELGAEIKGKVSPALYVLGIAAAAINVWAGIGLFAVVAIIWLVPDKRMERFLAENNINE